MEKLSKNEFELFNELLAVMEEYKRVNQWV